MRNLSHDIPTCANFGPVRWRRIAGWLRRIRAFPLASR